MLPFSASFAAIAEGQSEHATLKLTINPEEIRPGNSHFAALTFKLAPHWHIYWQNPGDSGLPMTLSWQLPAGVKAEAIHWPVPQRINTGGLVSYAFENEVTVLVPFTWPDPLPALPHTINLKADYLICKDICIPEAAEITLTIDNQAGDAATAALIEKSVEALPVPYTGISFYDENDGHAYLAFDTNAVEYLPLAKVKTAEFFPLDDGIIANDAAQHMRIDEPLIILQIKRGSKPLIASYRGVFDVTFDDGSRRAWQVTLGQEGVPVTTGQEQPTDIKTPTTDVAPSNPSASDGAAPMENKPPLTLLVALASAFLGGLILNIMPCVLPVLSLKALSIAKHGGQHPGQMRREALAYLLGILVSFGAIGGLLISLQQSGAALGWGFQLQSPVFVFALIIVLFLVGLNLSGLLELPVLFGNAGGERIARGGLGGSFFTGMLATLVATPCTAPFMATAFGFSLTQPPAIALLVFLMLGVGLAFPLVLISFIPPLARALPKPGNWMVRFKELLAFPIYATLIWLIWVLVQQAGVMAIIPVLSALLWLVFVLWLCRSTLPKAVPVVLVILTLAGLYQASHLLKPQAMQSATQQSTEVATYSEQALQQLLDTGKPVFVNATADWCITCKINERVALRDDNVRAFFINNNITYMQADWTNRNAEITEHLKRFGRNGVPLYVFYPVAGEPIILPQLLTPSLVIGKITEAMGEDLSQPTKE